MDIDKVLQNIIFKYDLDEYYPEYKDTFKAYELIEKYGLENQGKRILCISTNAHDFLRFKAATKGYLNLSNVLCKKQRSHLKNINKIYDTSVIEEIIPSNYDEIIVISFLGAGFVRRKLRKCKISHTSIYDYFLANSLSLEREYYSVFSDKSEEVFIPEYETSQFLDPSLYEDYCIRMQFQCENNEDLKTVFLKKLLFIAIYSKNIIKVKEYIELLIEREPEIDKYRELQGEIDKLISDIRTRISNRKSYAVINFWVDKIPYDESLEVSFIKNLRNNSVWFKNMFTVAPYTSATLRCMFCKARPFDDNGYKIDNIDSENSELISFLEDNDFEFHAISGNLKYFDDKYKPGDFFEVFPSTTKVLWETVRRLCKDDGKCFLIPHLLTHTHEPCLSYELTDDNIDVFFKYTEAGKKELNEQLSFYSDLITGNVTKIFMSDHGKDYFWNRFHTFFAVVDEDIAPKEIDGMASLLSFGDIIKQIVKNRNIKEEAIIQDYVPIQDIDFYDGKHIGSVLKNNKCINNNLIGYNGFADKDGIYLKFNNNVFYTIDRKNGNVQFQPSLVIDIENKFLDKRILERLHALNGTRLPEKEAKYTQYLYKALDDKTSIEFNRKKITEIYEILRKLPGKGIIFRGGGEHTEFIIAMLRNIGRENIIKAIIDDNPLCECSKYQYPTFNTKEKIKNVGAVLLSSFIYRDDFKKQADIMYKDIKVVDIYSELEKKDINCKSPFYHFEIKISGQELGFPFDEVGL